MTLNSVSEKVSNFMIKFGEFLEQILYMCLRPCIPSDPRESRDLEDDAIGSRGQDIEIIRIIPSDVKDDVFLHRDDVHDTSNMGTDSNEILTEICTEEDEEDNINEFLESCEILTMNEL